MLAFVLRRPTKDVCNFEEHIYSINLFKLFPATLGVGVSFKS